MNRRKSLQENMETTVNHLMGANGTVVAKLEELMSKASLNDSASSDDRMKALFDEANKQLLEEIKYQQRSQQQETQQDHQQEGCFSEDPLTAGVGQREHEIYSRQTSSSYSRASSMDFELFRVADGVSDHEEATVSAEKLFSDYERFFCNSEEKEEEDSLTSKQQAV
jgi:hypothetical protein